MRSLTKTNRMKCLAVFRGRYYSLLIQITATDPVNAKKHLKKSKRSAVDEQNRTRTNRRSFTHNNFTHRKRIAVPHGNPTKNHTGFRAETFRQAQNL